MHRTLALKSRVQTAHPKAVREVHRACTPLPAVQVTVTGHGHSQEGRSLGIGARQRRGRCRCARPCGVTVCTTSLRCVCRRHPRISCCVWLRPVDKHHLTLTVHSVEGSCPLRVNEAECWRVKTICGSRSQHRDALPLNSHGLWASERVIPTSFKTGPVPYSHLLPGGPRALFPPPSRRAMCRVPTSFQAGHVLYSQGHMPCSRKTCCQGAPTRLTRSRHRPLVFKSCWF